MKSYKDLIVWQKSMDAVTRIYEITKVFPREEEFALMMQIRRAAVSIPSNIAEGFGRQSTNEYKRFLKISRGSVYELQTQAEIAYRNNYITTELFISIETSYSEISKMLNSLINKLMPNG
jgi:four helix bundle protein